MRHGLLASQNAVLFQLYFGAKLQPPHVRSTLSARASAAGAGAGASAAKRAGAGTNHKVCRHPTRQGE